MPVWTTMNDLATGDLVTEADMDAIRGNIEYLLDPSKARVLRDNSGNYTTTSTAFVDVDAANLAVTLTTNGGPVLVSASGVARNTSSSDATCFDVAVDGTRVGDGFGQGLVRVTGTTYANMSFAVLVTGLAAGSHTFKLQWSVTAGTGDLISQSGKTPVQLTAIEL